MLQLNKNVKNWGGNLFRYFISFVVNRRGCREFGNVEVKFHKKIMNGKDLIKITNDLCEILKARYVVILNYELLNKDHQGKLVRYNEKREWEERRKQQDFVNKIKKLELEVK